MRYLFCLLYWFLCWFNCLFAQPAGSWQEHLPYNSVISAISASDKVFAATPFSCFSVSVKDGSVERFSRVNGLAETGVQSMLYANTGQLVIAYANSNIDIGVGRDFINVNSLLIKQINADKKIYQINGDGENCLLSTGFGVVVLNLVKKEIGDNWVIGNGGAYTKVNAATAFSGYYYVATEEGLKRAPVTGVNLSDYRNWELLSGSRELPAGPVQQLLLSGDDIFFQVRSSLYRLHDNSFQLIYTDEWNWINTSAADNRLFICQRLNNQTAVLELSTDGTVIQKLQDPLISHPRQVAVLDGKLWVADSLNGLLEINGLQVMSIQPNAPLSIGSGDIYAGRGEWWVATGNGLSQFAENQWNRYSGQGHTLPPETVDLVPVIMDKAGTVWAGSRGAGLLKKEEQSFSQIRSPLLLPATDNPDAYRVTGLAIDPDNNLWISNDAARNGLAIRYPDGHSRNFSIPFTYEAYALSQLLVDASNQKWIISPDGNGLFCYNHGTSIDNSGDDQWKYFRAGLGNGNLPSNYVLSIAEDAVGFIWVGTSDGIGIIQCAEHVFSGGGCEAILPVVQSDNFAGYLFKGEAVQAIAVDGANRKWIGTKNGVWLISADAEKTVFRFTVGNSPLLNNDVRKIAIDPSDGTVIFSTASGICSYKGDATAGAVNNSGVKVYPNPVPPGYNGMVVIRGLVNNAVVKITEINGRLVYQGRAVGGQVNWNGHDLNGKNISTGVYLLLISDDSRSEQLVSKIVFIQR